MDPVLAVPSYRVFRGSLAALFVGSIVAVWLLVLPPTAADKDQPPSSLAGVVQTAATPRPSGASAPVASATGTGTARPGSPTPSASGTPAQGSSTPTPAATATPTAVATATTYTVKSGDTLIGLADQFRTTPEAIQRANNISNPSGLQIGQVLTIPR